MIDRNLVLAIKKMIVKAGHIALNARKRGIEVEWKNDNSPVTNADKEISLFIFNELSNLTPKIPIICEERPIVAINKNKQFWLIDPIDGTKSFIKNKDSFTINIALIDKQLAAYGFVYQPARGILYFTDENQKFYIEKNEIAMDQNIHKQEGFVAVVSSNNFNLVMASYLKENNFSEVIAIPSSLKLCMIAEGAGDVFPKFDSTMEWDIAAGHALIRAVGGDIHVLTGDLMLYAKENFKNPYFIAANKKWLDT